MHSQAQTAISIPLPNGTMLSLSGIPKIMGILNVTPDSFSDGGAHNTPETAYKHALKLIEEGAHIVDIGGQSTRPGYQEISTEEETARTLPVIRALVQSHPQIPLSIDTYNPSVARMAVEAGASIINDVHGLQGSPDMSMVIADSPCAAILMHNDADLSRFDGDPMERVKDFLSHSLEIADKAGIPFQRIILDPGIGFGKTQKQNIEILARLHELHELGCPILLAVSRKSVIGHILGNSDPADRLEGTLALTALGTLQGVQLIRVHDVLSNLRAAKTATAIRDYESHLMGSHDKRQVF